MKLIFIVFLIWNNWVSFFFDKSHSFFFPSVKTAIHYFFFSTIFQHNIIKVSEVTIEYIQKCKMYIIFISSTYIWSCFSACWWFSLIRLWIILSSCMDLSAFWASIWALLWSWVAWLCCCEVNWALRLWDFWRWFLEILTTSWSLWNPSWERQDLQHF